MLKTPVSKDDLCLVNRAKEGLRSVQPSGFIEEYFHAESI
jgi:hypothetical protein